MLLILILLNFFFVRNQSALIRKNNSLFNNGVPESYAVDIDNNVDINKFKEQDAPTLKKGKKTSEGVELEIMYQQSAWDQIVAKVDLWEDTGNLSSQLRAVGPSDVQNEDASDLLDYILSTIKPFRNNSVPIADAGTALNMHNCSVDGVMEGLQRDGPATLTVHNDTATLIFTITTNTLKMDCEWYQWVMVKYYGVVSATLSSLTVETVVDLKLEPDQHPIVRKTTVKELGSISSDITGVGPLGILVRTIINNVIKQYRTIIIDTVEKQGPIAMQTSLNNITLPNIDMQTSLNNITLPSSYEIKAHLNTNPIEEKKINVSKVTERFVILDESNGTKEDNKIDVQVENTASENKKTANSNSTEKVAEDLKDNEIETQVEKTNVERIQEENDLRLLNEYGKNIHPKLKKVSSKIENTKYYKNREELDSNLLNDDENNINPKFKKIDKSTNQRSLL